MKKYSLILLALLLLSACTGCASDAEPLRRPFGVLGGNGTTDEKAFTAVLCDDGTAIVSLPGNATTGYVWEYAIDGNAVTGDGGNYVPSYADGRVGGGGIYHAVFTPVCDGTATVTFIYHRTFEQKAPIDTRVVTFTVADGKILDGFTLSVPEA